MTAEITVVYAGEEPPEQWGASLYLAGPTPRRVDVASWRPQALAEIQQRWTSAERLVVFVPEARDGVARPDYDEKRVWELHWGDRSDCVLVWIPRGPGMLGLTTNDEWGRWKDSGRVVLGTPPAADHVRYQRDYATEHHIPLADTLAETVEHALATLVPAAVRSGGQRHVPLLIWRTEAFQSWLSSVEAAGNELREARLEWACCVGPTRQFVLFHMLHAVIYVAAEDRLKDNEVILSRPDTASILAYRKGETLHKTEIVLVREFRTTCTTVDGFVRELPSGSSLAGMSDPRATAAKEFNEETGLDIHPARLRAHGARQAVATVSTHRTHLFSLELDEAEVAKMREGTGPHGQAAETERTYVEVVRLDDMLDSTTVDWTTLGAITEVLLRG